MNRIPKDKSLMPQESINKRIPGKPVINTLLFLSFFKEREETRERRLRRD
jgi:hypothetical protein